MMKLKFFLIMLLAGSLMVACDKGEKKDEEKKEDDKEQNDDTASQDEDSGAESSSAGWSDTDKASMKLLCKQGMVPQLKQKLGVLAKGIDFDSMCDCVTREAQTYYGSFSELTAADDRSVGGKIGEKCMGEELAKRK